MEVLVINETDQVIENKLQNYNITEAVISELKTRYLSLKINGLDDKEGAKLVKEAKSRVRSIRVLAERCCKEGRAAAIAEQKAWIAKEKEVVGQIDEVESHLDKQNEVVENERKRIRDEADRKDREILVKRIQTLIALGFSFNGIEYSLEGLVINQHQVQKYLDSNFADFIKEASVIFQRIEAEKAESERIKKEEELAATAERLRMEELAKKQAKREAELKAESDHLEEVKRKIELEKATAEATRLANIEAKQDRLALVELHRQHTVKAEADRVANEIQLKAEAETKIAQVKVDTENRIKKEVANKLEKERLENLELERKAALSPDKDKLLSIVARLQAFELPEVSSNEANKVTSMTNELIGKICKYINDKIQLM